MRGSKVTFQNFSQSLNPQDHTTLDSTIIAMATSYRTIDFWAPSLYANTLEEVCVPEPGPSRDPIVRHLPIKHADYEPVGVVKRMVAFNGGVSRNTGSH